MSKAAERQAIFRVLGNCARSHNEDWMSAMVAEGVNSGNFNERIIKWLKGRPGITEATLGGAMGQFAGLVGKGGFDALGQGETPLFLPGLKGWWRADLGITLNGDTVSQWNDISGNGNHATQTTEAWQLAYDATGFQGKEALVSGETTMMLVSDPVVSDEWTLVAAYKTDPAETGAYQFLCGNESTDSGFHLINRNATQSRVEIRDGATKPEMTSGNFTAGTPILVSAWTDAAGAAGVWNSVNGEVTGTLICGDTPQNLTLLGRTGMAGGDQFHGVCAEVMLYDRSLLAAEHGLLRAYLSARYQIALS